MIANVELSWLAPSKLRRTVVVGSKKMVVYEDGSAEPIKIFDRGVVYKDPETFGEYQLSYRTGDILSPQLSSDEPLALQLGDFVAAIQSGERPEHGLRLARDVVRLAEAAEASMQQRRRRRSRSARANSLRARTDDRDRRRLEPASETRRLVHARASRSARGAHAPRLGAAAAAAAPATPLAVFARARARAAVSDRTAATARMLLWGLAAVPLMVVALQALRPLRPRREADQPLDGRRPAVAVPRDA